MSAVPRLKLIAVRKSVGKSRANLALELGVSRQSVFRIESGERDPSLPLVERWLHALGRDADDAGLFFTQQDAA